MDSLFCKTIYKNMLGALITQETGSFRYIVRTLESIKHGKDCGQMLFYEMIWHK